MRLCLILFAALFAGALAAERITDFNDTVFLRSYETVRYRIPFDYGSAPSADLRVIVRGFGAPPRVRLLNADFGEARESRDTNGDGIVDFTHRASQPRYWLEVDSAAPGDSGDFEIRVLIDAADGSGASAQVEFDKYFRDYWRDDHDGCTTREGGLWWLGALAALGAGLAIRRRRLA